MSKQTIRALAWSGVIAAALAGLVAGIGVDVIHQYHERLFYDVGDHLRLVAISMAMALVTGVPAGIALSRPCMRRWADRLMQIFNIGNTVPSLAVLALALAVLGIGERPAVLALWLASPAAHRAEYVRRAAQRLSRLAARGRARYRHDAVPAPGARGTAHRAARILAGVRRTAW